MNKYLKVTIHDNDFTYSLEQVCELLYDTFQRENRYPVENDLPNLATSIQYMWYGVNMAKDIMRWGDSQPPSFDYFFPYLTIVKENEIPNWDNAETVFIPMFDDGSIFIR